MDPLTILITGDVSGIETAVKQALNIVQGGVESMNDQTVDWTAIFSRAVSPAIISGVASVFAFAISQALEFQQAMNETGTAAGLTSTQIGQMGVASQSLADQTGQSATDIGSAFGAVAPVFADTATQQAFVADATQLAASGFGSLSDVVSAALPIMQQFGVTTAAQVNQVFTELMHGAEGSGESFVTFAGQFSQVTPQLIQGGAKLSDLNNLLSGFSAEVANLSPAEAAAAFQAFGQAVSGTDLPLNALTLSSAKLLDIVRTQGLPQAIADMGQKIADSGQSAALLYSSIGLSALAFDGLTSSTQRLPAIAADAKLIATNSQSIADAFNQSDSSLREFQEDYQKLLGLFTNDSTVTTFFTDVAKAIGLVIDAEKWIIDNSGQILQALVNPWSALDTAITKIPELIQSIFSGSALSTIENLFGKITSAAQSLLGTQSSGLNSALQGTGVGFSASQLSGIDSVASGSGLINSLVSALQTGIKGSQYTQLVNTFNLTVPTGGATLNAKQIAQQLYNQFQGTQ